MTNVLRPTIALAAVAATIAVLLVAGCGGSSKSTGSNGTTASASPMVTRADAICKVLNEHRKAANKEVGKVSSASLKKIAELAPFLQAFERNTLAELRKLTPPSEIAAPWEKILAGAELLADHASKLGEAASDKNLKAVEALVAEDQRSEKELIPIATKAGFKHCGLNV
jgi:hypothetical protein